MAATALSPLAVLSAKKAAQASNSSAMQSESASQGSSGFAQALQARANRSSSSDAKSATSKLASNVKAQNPANTQSTSTAQSSDAAAQAAAAAAMAAPQASDADAALLAAISGLAGNVQAQPQQTTATPDGEALAAQTAGLSEASAKLAAQPQEFALPEQGEKDSDPAAGKALLQRDATAPGAATARLGLQEDAAKASLTAASGQSDFASELNNATANTQTATAPLGHAAHNAGVTTQATQTTDSLPAHEVRTPVAARGWAEEVGQKVSWIASRDAGRAELILTPPQLGRIEVSINIHGDQASANFVAASAAARDALNDSMPRLREVLAEAGINLGQADVSANSSNQSQGDSQDSARSGRMRGALGGDDSTVGSAVSTTAQNMLRAFNGRVDTFA